MKKFISLIFSIVLLIAMAIPAAAVDSIQSKAMFTSYTGASGSARYSAVTNTGLLTKKTVVINGMYSASAYGNYSGTVKLEGAPTPSGPWVTLKDKTGNAVSATTNTVFNLDDLTQYIRASWTKTKHRVSVWLYYAP